jgi:CubicO group peptidase (beta-lactamase class C family)
MSGEPRSLPSRPSLRYLRLEAKRRLSTAEFATLHDAQVAIAREHGLPSWAALKQRIQADTDSHALAQLHWVIDRFSAADQPGWIAPDSDEMRAHFDDRFLAVISPGDLAAVIAAVAADLRGELTVIRRAVLAAEVQLAGIRYVAAVDEAPPHRLLGLQGFPVGERITGRTAPSAQQPAHQPAKQPAHQPAALPARTQGPVPGQLADLADETIADLGLPALVLAGGEPGRAPWVIASGLADLDRDEPLTPAHRFPTPGVTTLVTVTAVLRLVAAAQLSLDTNVNKYLRDVRLEDDAVTVRDLLSHTSGVDSPAELYGDSVHDLLALTGPVVPCSGPRGKFQPSNGSYAVLGQLIADVSRTSFARAATQLVLDPLGMRDSRFPARPADIGAGAVTRYTVTSDGAFMPVQDQMLTIEAAGGLWSTGADLVRLGTGWASLLPAALAHEALTMQAQPRQGSGGVGFGWLLGARGDIAEHAGLGLDSAASLLIRVRDHRTQVVLTSRSMPLASLGDRLQRSWTNH